MQLRSEDEDAVREESLQQQPPFPPLTRSISTIDSTILSPGAVKINFQGAFIVDEELPATSGDGAQHDSKDIRLPNHKAVVSHVALDASSSPYTVASTSLNTM